MFLVTRQDGYDPPTYERLFETEMTALVWALGRAVIDLDAENDAARRGYVTEVTRLERSIEQRGRDHVPDDLMLTTISIGGEYPEPKSLGQRLEEVVNRGPYLSALRDLDDGYQAGNIYWTVTEVGVGA